MKTISKLLILSICILFIPLLVSAEDFWIKQNFPDSVYVILLRINQNDVLFVSANFTDTTGLPHGQIYRSIDYAETWENITPDYYFPEIMDIEFGADGTLFLGTWYGGVYRSYDEGDSFEHVDNGLSNSVPTELAIQSDGTIYAGQFWGGGVDYSEDDGDQWYPTTFPLTGVNGLGIDNYDAIYASAEGLLFSDDDGLTWVERNNGFSNSAMWNYKCFAFTQSNFVYAGTTDGIYTSNNNGELWENTLSSSRVYHIEIVENIIFAGTVEEGVYFSDNGGNSWSQKNEGLDWLAVFSFATDSEIHIWCNTPEGIYRSVDEIVSVDNFKIRPNELSIYPNPCADFLNIHLSEHNFQNLDVSFYNLNGKLILKETRKMNEFHTKTYTFNIGRLESGIYLVCLKMNGNLMRTEKLLVQ